MFIVNLLSKASRQVEKGDLQAEHFGQMPAQRFQPRGLGDGDPSGCGQINHIQGNDHAGCAGRRARPTAAPSDGREGGAGAGGEMLVRRDSGRSLSRLSSSDDCLGQNAQNLIHHRGTDECSVPRGVEWRRYLDHIAADQVKTT